ncbi:hypothetical protein DIZ27_43100 [Streptomyces sp. NWU339]|nr:hypothetical protein DIZ27_43100 [Streptomyces sp. NWU339]
MWPSGRPVTEVARELGVSPESLRGWVKEGPPRPPDTGSGPDAAEAGRTADRTPTESGAVHPPPGGSCSRTPCPGSCRSTASGGRPPPRPAAAWTRSRPRRILRRRSSARWCRCGRRHRAGSTPPRPERFPCPGGGSMKLSSMALRGMPDIVNVPSSAKSTRPPPVPFQTSATSCAVSSPDGPVQASRANRPPSSSTGTAAAIAHPQSIFTPCLPLPDPHPEHTTHPTGQWIRTHTTETASPRTG